MKKLFILCACAVFMAACSSETKLFKQAQLATEKGQFQKAAQLYTSVIKENPQNFAAYANRALLFERMTAKNDAEKAKNRSYAERDYLAALEIAPHSAETQNNLGAFYIDDKEYLNAIYHLSNALNAAPNYYLARLNRAIAYSQSGRVPEAMEDFFVSARQRPMDPSLFLNRGLAYFQQAKYQEAAEDFTFLSTLQPENARPYLERGRSLMKMGFMGDAEADFETAARLSPGYVLAYYYLGELSFMHGDIEQALNYLTQVKTLSPKWVNAYDLMGDMLALEEPVEATKNYLVAKQLDPANAPKYDRKMAYMRSDRGRQYVVASRFLKK